MIEIRHAGSANGWQLLVPVTRLHEEANATDGLRRKTVGTHLATILSAGDDLDLPCFPDLDIYNGPQVQNITRTHTCGPLFYNRAKRLLRWCIEEGGYSSGQSPVSEGRHVTDTVRTWAWSPVASFPSKPGQGVADPTISSGCQCPCMLQALSPSLKHTSSRGFADTETMIEKRRHHHKRPQKCTQALPSQRSSNVSIAQAVLSLPALVMMHKGT